MNMENIQQYDLQNFVCKNTEERLSRCALLWIGIKGVVSFLFPVIQLCYMYGLHLLYMQPYGFFYFVPGVLIYWTLGSLLDIWGISWARHIAVAFSIPGTVLLCMNYTMLILKALTVVAVVLLIVYLLCVS